MSQRFDHGYALLIGVDAHSVDTWALPDVAKDVAALRQVLTHPDRCGYLKEHVKVLSGAEATRTGIMKGLAWLRQQIEADGSGSATAVVYYTGHGWLDTAADPPAAYLIPHDTVPDMIPYTALPAADFSGAIDGLGAERLLVILDCCHAGAMGVKDAAAAAPAGFRETAIAPALLLGQTKDAAAAGTEGLEALSGGSGRAVLSSSTGSQVSYVRADGAMSVFTYHLIEALTGHAQPAGGAAEVLVTDVMSHTTRRVPESARALGGEQTPDYRLTGNYPVALLLGGKGLAKGQRAPDPLGAAAEGRAIHIVDTGGGAYVGGDLNTGGGAFVGGQVDTGGGDFVGRDQTADED